VRRLDAALESPSEFGHAQGVNAMANVSVIVPVYNEVGAVGETLRQLLGAIGPLGPDSEIVAVDDGSNDGTGDVLSKVAGIRVLRHDHNLGYGAALKTGIRAARNAWIAITDADGTYPNDRIPGLLETAESQALDMVVGARPKAGKGVSAFRGPAKWFITALAERLAGQRIPDLNSGLRVFRKSVARQFMPILPDGFSFTTTITLAMLSNGYGVTYVPIEYRKRTGASKIRPIRDTLTFIQLIVRMTMYFNPLRVFVPLSLLLFTSSLLALVYRLVHGQGLASLSIILFIAGIQVLTTGMIADLIDRRLVLAAKNEER
jgi:glycosyltransferase involved in cell wall biosynthesis